MTTTDEHECGTCHAHYASLIAARLCCTDEEYDRGYD